jgi:hypothetical protein
MEEDGGFGVQWGSAGEFFLEEFWEWWERFSWRVRVLFGLWAGRGRIFWVSRGRFRFVCL